MNQISILIFFLFLRENIFSDINAISLAINHLGIRLEIIWKAHLFWEGVVINKCSSCGKFYLYIHAFSRESYSCIHSFTSPSRWLGVGLLCAFMCVTHGVVLRCCGLVLFPRGLSSFTESWQKMEAGRGVRCIKKPLPCSDLSPLPHTLTHTHTNTHTYTCQPLAISHYCSSTLHSIKHRHIV